MSNKKSEILLKYVKKDLLNLKFVMLLLSHTHMLMAKFQRCIVQEIYVRAGTLVDIVYGGCVKCCVLFKLWVTILDLMEVR
jgi:hypothetical protein